MNKKRMNPNDVQEEALWRTQVLGHTSRVCAAKARELEHAARRDVPAPAYDAEALRSVLKRIDNVLEWRFVNPLGEVTLDPDCLAEYIDCDTLRTIRRCVEGQLERIATTGGWTDSYK